MSELSDKYRVVVEDKVKNVVDNWNELECYVGYFYLRNSRNCSMEQIEYKIEDLIRQTIKKGGGN